MNTCPSCSFRLTESSTFCIRCGFSLLKNGPRLASLRNIFTWVLRRSLAGFTAGLAGWCVVAAANRAAGANLSAVGHILLSGILGGIFLGTVEGMMEESSLKTIKGGVSGALGGLLGGVIASWALSMGMGSESAQGMTAVVATWGVTGAAIGTVSAWLERKRSRLLAGALAGALGGALGGWLGYQMFASIMDIFKPEPWYLKRIVEGATGAIIGAILWFILGLAEKLFIFKRRVVADLDKKKCDACHKDNALNAWYCGFCGAVLQVSAPPEKLQPPRRLALARFISACQYLGRLCATTAIVVAGLAGFFLGTINVFLGLFGLLASALIGYMAYILFNTLAETLSTLL